MLITSEIRQPELFKNIKIIVCDDVSAWDLYVKGHPSATLYHLAGWKNVIEKTYGHKTYYLMAMEKESKAQSSKLKGKSRGQLNPSSDLTGLSNRKDYGNSKDEKLGCWEAERIGSKKQRNAESQPRMQRSTDNPQYTFAKPVGILPLVHLKHFIFGNQLVSVPFFDMGGILADDEEIEKALFSEAIRLAENLNVDKIELRHTEPLSILKESLKLVARSLNTFNMSYELSARNYNVQTHAQKVRMVLDLPNSSNTLMKSFKSKLRSQIKKPSKEGLHPKIGGIELLKDFYQVFSINMKDLGSPVHSKKITQNILEEFPNKSKIIIVYKENQPLAGSVVVGFKDILENPWASSLRQYSRLCPNMLLYWTMLEFGCDNGYKRFDFGRSTPTEGTFKFKEQWGAKPKPLYWHSIYVNGNAGDKGTADKSRFEKAIHCWAKLPVTITKIIGPRIRKYISL